MIQITRTNSENKDFNELIQRLDIELHGNYGALQTQYNQYNKIALINTVVVTYDNHVPVGCGCFKPYDDTAVEIKRMFVRKDYRGKGISKMILHELELWAKEKCYQRSVLETGSKQTEAIGLYQRCGYSRIDNYGPYKGNDNSLCMAKVL
jgi:GNAT superfamily N-acetyltransferase